MIQNTDEKKRTKEPFRSEDNLFQSLVDRMLDAVAIIDWDGTILFVNDAGAKLVGLQYPGDCIGVNALEFIHPDYRAAVADDLKLIKNGKRGSLADYRVYKLRLRNGEERWVEGIGTKVQFKGRSADLITLRDITERKWAEEAFRDRESKLDGIFRAAPVGIGMVVDRVFHEVNDTMCEMVGYSRDELLGQSARILYLSQEDYEYVGNEKYAQIAETGVGKVETRWRRKDGTIIDVLLRSAALDDADHIKGVLFTALDITERKNAEKALQAAHDNLEQLVKERTADLMAKNKELRREIKERRRVEAELKKKSGELGTKSTELEELNSALRMLITQRDEDRKELEEKIMSNVKALIMPYIEKLKKGRQDSEGMFHLSILESNLKNIISPFSHRLSSKYTNMTPKEIQVANLIKEGKSTREIAELMHVSRSAIDLHRYHIRNKLGLKKRKINLKAYLLSIS